MSSAPRASCGFDQTIVAIGGAADEVREGVDLAGAEVVVNEDFGEGCSSSIAAALGVVDPRCEVLVLMLGDQPGVRAETVAALRRPGRGDAPIAVCRYEDGRGHPIAFSKGLFSDLAELHGDRGVWRMLDAAGDAAAEVPVEGPIPRDVDTEDDYRAVLAEMSDDMNEEVARLVPDVETLAQRLAAADYLVDEGLATSIFLSLRLPQPLLLEGEAGVGKTEAALSLAALLETPLIRLQCYEGIDAAEALYEWNYPRQLLAIRLADSEERSLDEQELFGPDYLIRRPLLQALEHPGPRPAVLLIDEIDRADDDFEAFLLELLGGAAVTIPELGTIRATHPPIIVLDLEQDPRPPRRGQTPLPLPLDRLPDGRSGRSRSSADGSRAPRRRSRSRLPTRSRGCVTPTCRSRPGSPRRSTGSPRSRCSGSRALTPRRSTSPSGPCSSTKRTRS